MFSGSSSCIFGTSRISVSSTIGLAGCARILRVVFLHWRTSSTFFTMCFMVKVSYKLCFMFNAARISLEPLHPLCLSGLTLICADYKPLPTHNLEHSCGPSGQWSSFPHKERTSINTATMEQCKCVVVFSLFSPVGVYSFYPTTANNIFQQARRTFMHLSGPRLILYLQTIIYYSNKRREVRHTQLRSVASHVAGHCFPSQT